MSIVLRRPIVYFQIFFEKIKIKKINIPDHCLNGLKLLVLLAKVLPQTCLKGVSRCLKNPSREKSFCLLQKAENPVKKHYGSQEI